MILVHKQQFPLSTPYAHHRRHPSAPPAAVVVQPTRTPGLLSLSKPVQRQQPQQPRAKLSPKVKQNRSPRATPLPETASVLKPSPEIIDKKSSPVSSARGRQQSKPKEKPTTRSSSHSAVRGRRNNARQQSPPLPTSQAEVPSPIYKSTNSNLFDPFLDEPTVRSKSARPAPPTLASRPSGKLARRRQPNFASTQANSPPKAIPVPRLSHSSPRNISRSEPTASNLRSRKSGKADRDVFPICDDFEDDSEDDSTPPATPTRSRPSARFTLSFDDGPRTAPITAPTHTFPFTSSSPSPAGKKGARRHKRTPSEGVFAMSSDEEVSSHENDLKTLLGLVSKGQPISKELEEEREAAAAAAAAAAYFASSNFQNSPSPEELPPPTFAFL